MMNIHSIRLTIALILFLCLNSACNSPGRQNTSHRKVIPIKKTLSNKNSEYLDWDSVKLNGSISMISGFKDVVNKLGQPNRINKLAEGVNGSFYNKKFQYCYFKGLAFEKYNDTLVFGEINFKESPGFYLLNGKYRFDRNTRAADFKRLFPNAFENNELSGTDMNKYHWISLPVSLKRSDDDWAFLFDRNTEKLLKIEHDDK